MPYNGYSEEYLDRLENGNIPADNKSYSKRKSFDPISVTSCGRCDKENAPFQPPPQGPVLALFIVGFCLP